ncbi:unnamed protein product [Penicillium olsonii]|nr:unnamed protein product [Penicillium olsonii]CAG7933186.1 unnamed protein product [Penicillium olsonii]
MHLLDIHFHQNVFHWSSSEIAVWYKHHRYYYSPIRNLLTEDQNLRKQVQREERLHNQITALQKASAIESSTPELDEITKELQETQKTYARKEHALYKAECLLHPVLKEAYIKLRRDATWFMREGLVQDCADRGGCCGRQCGCCAKRHLSTRRRRGEGHCTTECGCCISSRGYDLPKEEKDKISSEFVGMLESRLSPHFINLANGYISPAKPHGLGKIESWWKEMFGPDYYDKKIV